LYGKQPRQDDQVHPEKKEATIALSNASLPHWRGMTESSDSCIRW